MMMGLVQKKEFCPLKNSQAAEDGMKAFPVYLRQG
jgi:hypothetical protein